MDSKTFYRDDGNDAGEPLAVRPRIAASKLGVSESTLDRLRKAGRVPFVKLDGAILYRVASLDQFLLDAEQRVQQDTA